MEAKELRIGNAVYFNGEHEEVGIVTEIKSSITFEPFYLIGLNHRIDVYYDVKKLQPIPLTEEILLKCGFEIVNQNSAGKRYSYVVDGVFSQDFNLVFWTTTKNFGKIYRGNLQIKHLHQLQNLYFALTGEELNVKL